MNLMRLVVQVFQKSEIDVFVVTLQPGASLFSFPSKIYSACHAEWDMVSDECTLFDFDLGYYYSFGFCDDSKQSFIKYLKAVN